MDKIQGILKNNEPILLQFFLEITKYFAKRTVIRDSLIRIIMLVIFTGCGHPTIELIVKQIRCLSDEPIHIIGGGLHYPVTGGRGGRAGLDFQTFMGTGKPFWQKITDEELGSTINAINSFNPSKVFPSAHDTCDQSLARMDKELKAETEVLRAGKTYRF